MITLGHQDRVAVLCPHQRVDGRVVVARGYGVRHLDRPEPVDEHTRFGIASNTKAFTATALALLVGKGRPTGYIAVGLIWVTVITLFVI